MKYTRKIRPVLKQFLGRFGTPPIKNVEAAGERVFQNVFVRREGAQLTPRMDAEPVRFTNSRLPAFALALAALALVLVLPPIRKTIWQPEGIAEAIDSGLFLTDQGKNRELRAGEKIGAGEMVRAIGDASALFKLTDGSRIEMRPGSELLLERADDGVRLRLKQGTVIVNAARQRNGHLYVQTRDMTISVVGTVFFVTTEEIGSRVGVLEGAVDVKYAGESRRLKAGAQFSTYPSDTSAGLFEAVSWSRYAEEHRALLPQSAGPEFPKQEPEKSAVLSSGRQRKAVSRSGFDAISIRRNKSDQPTTFGDGGPGRYRATNVPIGLLILSAYDIKDFQLIGAPDWVSSERYDIEATLEDPARRDEMGPLIQALLEDRFKLRVHGQAKETEVYFLVPAKGGLKLKARTCTAAEGYAPVARGRDYSTVCGFLAGTDFSLRATSTTVTELTNALSGKLGRRVLDKTGFKAPFDVNLNWRPDTSGPENPVFANLPSIFVALEEELGLKLESGRAPIDALVIDQIERPSEN